MKYATGFIAALALATEVVAFPAAMYEELAKRSAEQQTRDIEAAIESYETVKARQAVTFDPKLQYVSNQGQYKFVPPTKVNQIDGDQRGPCPGLNAMANHGYLPHNGIATIQQFIDGTYQVFGMGKDLGGFLAIYGAIIDGNGLAWSIGGPSTQLGGLGSDNILLSPPQGISGSHNKYEADASPTRPDLYQYGNDYKVIQKQFDQMFALQPNAATANYDLSVLTPFRAARFQQSINENPYFFNGPFSGVLVQPAAYTFIYRFMANKSAEYPEGRLDQETLKSFFSITGQPGSFKWTEGYEKIPDNWYKRAIGDEYTIPFFLADATAAALQYPQFLSIGGNTGKVNTFTGIDPTNLTGGVLNAQTFAQNNNFACFAYQFLQQATPDLTRGIFLNNTSVLGRLNNAFSAAFGPLNCPQLKAIDTKQFQAYPGSHGTTSTF